MEYKKMCTSGGRSRSDVSIKMLKGNRVEFIFRNNSWEKLDETGHIVTAVCLDKIYFRSAGCKEGFMIQGQKAKNRYVTFKAEFERYERWISKNGNEFSLEYDEQEDLYFIRKMEA